MKKLGILVLTIGLFAAKAGALPLWDVNFSDPVYQVGQTPPTKSATAGAVNKQPTSISNSSEHASLLVQESFAAGGTVMGGQPLVMSYKGAGSGNITMTFSGAGSDYTSPSGFVFSFDFMLRADETLDGPLGIGNFLEIRLQNNNSQQITRFIFKGDESLVVYNSFGVDSTFNNAYSLNTVHHFYGVMNDTATAFSIYIDNNYVGTVSWSYAEGEEDLAGLRSISFRNGTDSKNSAWSAGINNIKVDYAAIPEVSHAALLIGLPTVACLLVWRRRSR